MTQLCTIETLNQATLDDFTVATNILFESAPPLALHLYSHRPYASWPAVLSAAESAVRNPTLLFSPNEVTAIINAHPRLGDASAGLSVHSRGEQGAADAAVDAELMAVNRVYEDRFGFRAVVFVDGRGKAEMVRVLKERVASGERESEVRSALDAMMLIARSRLSKME
ncbi:hypothetical protein HDU98_010319 [Podochytrium sp. JEL0797]|nr:hypothetical protein HDU98_010319 [Podochytrium sp. JEL0797]